MSTTDLPGSSLLAGRYRLVERLGAGGMSVVWRGFDEVLGRQVAVKVLPPSTSADPSFRRRLRAEAQAAARLSHPHITNVYDYGEATTVDGEPVPYVVMELVDGESLAAVLARSRRLPWTAALRICSEVSAALAAAHARGIVHRDVTPANVMLTPSGAKVVDFGISALIGENDIDPDGSLLGTPAYLAPERLEGGQVSPASDVYAVGLLIYRTLIGQLPWDVGTTTALLRAHQYTEPEPLPYVEGLPPAVEALIARCLEKRPDDRPSSAELAHVLAGVVADTPLSRGFVPDWADSSDDTTILPSVQWHTDSFGQDRPAPAWGEARGVAEVGRGQGAAGGHSRVSDAPISPAPGSAMPISISAVQAAVDGRRFGATTAPAGPPAPAQPSDLADPARHGQLADPAHPARHRQIPFDQADPGRHGPQPSGPAAAPPPSRGARGPLPAGSPAASALPSGPAASALPSDPAAAPLPGHGPRGPLPGHGGARNSRFAGTPRVGPGVNAAGTPTVLPPAEGSATMLRPAFGDRQADRLSRAGNAGSPPGEQPPGQKNGGDNSRPGRAGKIQNHRVAIVAGMVAVLGGAAYGWSLAGGDSKNATTPVVPETAVVAASGKCVVSYTVWSDQNGRFKASVSVANRDTTPIKNWQLWFLMPGDQVMSGNGKEKLDQQNGAVTVTANEALPPQATKTMQVTGRYKESNAAPMVFQLDGQTCETYVSGKPGAPSQPVEHLTDGTTRLGPVAASNTPVPGLSTKPNGVVVPIPVISTSSGTPTSGSTLTANDPTPSSSGTTDQGPEPSPPSNDSSGTPSPSASATTDSGPPPIITVDPDASDVD